MWHLPLSLSETRERGGATCVPALRGWGPRCPRGLSQTSRPTSAPQLPGTPPAVPCVTAPCRAGPGTSPGAERGVRSRPPVPRLHLASLHKVLIRPRVQAQPLGLVPARPPPRPRFSYSLTVTLGVGGGEGGRRCGDPASTVRPWVATGQLSLCCLCVPGAGRCGPACLGDQSHSC